MIFEGMNLLAVALAAIAGMVTGAIWYGVFAKPWMKAVGYEEEPKPDPASYAVALVVQVIVAYALARLINFMGPHTLFNGISAAVFAWFGFTLAPMALNHRFQDKGWDLTLIDGGYWLTVLVLMGAIIGWMGL